MCLLMPILAPFVIFYVLVALVLCLVSGFFCCCFCGGECLGRDRSHGAAITVIAVLLPIMFLLEDFGVHVPLLDVVFPELRAEGDEIPALDVTLTISNSSSNEESEVGDETGEFSV